MRQNLISLLFLFSLAVYGTHNRAGEILYKRIAPFYSGAGTNTVAVYTYSFTIIKYTNDGPNIADRCVDTLHFGDGSSGVATRINGLTGACSCNPYPCGEIIINDPGYRVKKNIYSIVHTYSTAGNYVAYSQDPNRNADILNIPNSVNIPFYIESYVVANNSFVYNSSPVLANPPADRGCIGSPYYHNVCAYDEDGDSLSYQLIPCEIAAGQPAPGYSFPATGAGGSFSIQATNGLVTWNNPQAQGEYNFAIKITEWRKLSCNSERVFIGYVIRDMQSLVLVCTPSPVNIVPASDTCVVAGNNFVKNFTVNGPSLINLLIVGASNNSINLPNSVITPNTGSNTFGAAFTWNTNCAQIKNYPDQINIISQQSPNGITLQQYSSFRLKLVPPAPPSYSFTIDTNYVVLKWTKPSCANLKGYNIYRKLGSNNWSHSACENGVPAYSGFNFMAFNSVSDTTFLDNYFWWFIPNGSICNYIITSVMDDCSESFATIHTVNLLVGLSEKTLSDNDITVSPNPFSNQVDIETRGIFKKLETTIYSPEGKMLLYAKDEYFAGKTSIQTDELAEGLYFINIKTEGGSITKKIINCRR
jgi:hypothetical protein